MDTLSNVTNADETSDNNCHALTQSHKGDFDMERVRHTDQVQVSVAQLSSPVQFNQFHQRCTPNHMISTGTPFQPRCTDKVNMGSLFPENVQPLASAKFDFPTFGSPVGNYQNQFPVVANDLPTHRNGDQSPPTDRLLKFWGQRQRDLRPGHELRISVDDDQQDAVCIRVHSKIPDTFASAEIFGKELVLGNDYFITSGKTVAIFTWHGCCVEIKGRVSLEFDSHNPTMSIHVNIALAASYRRRVAYNFLKSHPSTISSLYSCDLDSALKWVEISEPTQMTDEGDKKETSIAPPSSPQYPPRVLIVGPPGSGKTTLCYQLVNFALRRFERPIYINLDPRGCNVYPELPSLPGLISAAICDENYYSFGFDVVSSTKIFNAPKDLNSDAAYQAHLLRQDNRADYGVFRNQQAKSNQNGRCLHYWVPEIDLEENPNTFRWYMSILARVVRSRVEHALNISRRIFNTVDRSHLQIKRNTADIQYESQIILSKETLDSRTIARLRSAEMQQSIASAGVIIDPPAGAPVELIERIIEEFDVNMICVIEDADICRKLSNFVGAPISEGSCVSNSEGIDFLSKLFPRAGSQRRKYNGIDICLIPKCLGAGNQTDSKLKRISTDQIRNYFNGLKRDLALHLIQIRIPTECEIFTFVNETHVNKGRGMAMPRLTPYTGDPLRLVGRLLAVVLVSSPHKLATTDCSCLVLVKDADEEYHENKEYEAVVEIKPNPSIQSNCRVHKLLVLSPVPSLVPAVPNSSFASLKPYLLLGDPELVNYDLENRTSEIYTS